nr:hypothetical protein [Lachnospiraceae bacterium]
GLFASVSTALSARLILGCGFELRSYGFLVFFSTATIYYFLKRFSSAEKKYHYLYTVMMLLTIYTHYMGSLVITALGMVELLVIILRKKSIKRLIPYFVTVALFLPWFILMLLHKQKSISSFWPTTPTLPKIVRIIRKLLSSDELLFVALIITFLYVIFRVIRNIYEKKTTSFKHFSVLTLSWIVLFILGSVFIYSTIINPAGGFFVQRYFMELVPVMLIIDAVGISEAIEFITSKRERALRLELTAIAASFIVLYIGMGNLREVRETSSTSSETFKEAADWIKSQDGLYDADSAVVCSVNPRATAGFVEYYIRDGAIKPDLPMISLQDYDPVSDLKKYNKLYLVYVHRDMDKLEDDVMDYLAENFDIAEDDEDIKAALLVRK